MLMFDMPIWLCVLAGVAVYGFLEFRFRRFLKNLVRIEKGVYYVDHSFRVKTKKEALEIGRKHKQISVFGWARKNLAYC